MAKSFAILLPYYQRKEQLDCTLRGLYESYGDCNIYIAVDDEDSILPFRLSKHHKIRSFPTYRNMDSRFRNPAVLFNLLASIAQEDYLVLSNPEVYHLKPVLLHAAQEAQVGRYLVYGCKNLTGSCLPGFTELGIWDKDFPWYQHSVHRPAMLHFCSVISREDYWNIGGFDPGYDAGFAWEDNDFVQRVKHGGLEIVQVDDPYVGHQWHERPPQEDPLLIAKIVRNRWYYVSKWGGEK